MTPTDRLLFDHTNQVLALLQEKTGLTAPPLSEADFLALKAEVAHLDEPEPDVHDLNECRCDQCRAFWREVLLLHCYGADPEHARRAAGR